MVQAYSALVNWVHIFIEKKPVVLKVIFFSLAYFSEVLSNQLNTSV